jgi:uncharacterized protein YjaG (DUF416 family)
MNNTQKLSTFQRLRELKPTQRALFAATVLSRMVPHFALYFDAHEANEEAPLAQHVLDLIWQKLSDPKQKLNYNAQIEKIEAVLPDPAIDDTFGALPAVDAGLGLVALLKQCQDPDEDAAVVVAKLAQGGVEAFLLATDFAEDYQALQNLTDPEAYDHANRALNQAIKAHPLMAFEVAFANDVIDFILQADGKYAALVAQLKQLARDTEITTLGIALESE